MAAIPPYPTADVLPPNEFGEINSSFGKLPPELLDKILRSLPSACEEVRLVCRRWSQIYTAEALWKKKFLQAFGTEPETLPGSWKTHYLSECKRRGWHLRSIILDEFMGRYSVGKYDPSKDPSFVIRNALVFIRGEIFDCDRKNGEEKIHDFHLSHVATVLKDGKIAGCDEKKSVEVWDLDALDKPIHILQTEEADVSEIIELPDGRILTKFRDRSGKIWDRNREQSIEIDPQKENIVAARRSWPIDPRLVCETNGIPHTWDVKLPYAEVEKIRKDSQSSLQFGRQIYRLLPLRDGSLLTINHNARGKRATFVFWRINEKGIGEPIESVPCHDTRLTYKVIQLKDSRLVTIIDKADSNYFLQAWNFDKPYGEQLLCTRMVNYTCGAELVDLCDGRVAFEGFETISVFSLFTFEVEHSFELRGPRRSSKMFLLSLDRICMYSIASLRAHPYGTKGVSLEVWQIPPKKKYDFEPEDKGEPEAGPPV